MNTRIVIGLSVFVILLLVGAGVFVMFYADSSIQQVRVYEVPEYTEPQPNAQVVVTDTTVSEPEPYVSETADSSSSDLAVADETIIASDEVLNEFDMALADVEEEEVETTDSAYAAALNPPTPPTRGLIDLIDAVPDDATYDEFERTMTDYVLTYYPLAALEPEEVSQLDPQAKAAYDRQEAALHKEVMDMIKEDFASVSPEMLATFPADMANLFEKEGLMP